MSLDPDWSSVEEVRIRCTFSESAFKPTACGGLHIPLLLYLAFLFVCCGYSVSLERRTLRCSVVEKQDKVTAAFGQNHSTNLTNTLNNRNLASASSNLTLSINA